MLNDDVVHRYLQTKIVKLINEKKIEELNEIVEVEKPYNWYGDRGFIDIYEESDYGTNIREVKPFLYNVGETIRQLKKAEAVFNKGKKIRISLHIDCFFSKENVKIVEDCFDLFSSAGSPLRIAFYDKEGKEIHAFRPIYTKKYGMTFKEHFSEFKLDKKELLSEKEIRDYIMRGK